MFIEGKGGGGVHRADRRDVGANPVKPTMIVYFLDFFVFCIQY